VINVTFLHLLCAEKHTAIVRLHLDEDEEEVSSIDEDYVYNSPSTYETTTEEESNTSSGDEEEDDGPNGRDLGDPMQLYNAHKDSFYRSYTTMYEKVKGTTHLISNETYAYIVSVLTRKPIPKNESMKDRKYRATYKLSGNIEGACLFRGGQTVTTFERVFDVILEAHKKLSHAKCPRRNKLTINRDLNYYGVPQDAVKCFIDCCPMVSDCTFPL